MVLLSELDGLLVKDLVRELTAVGLNAKGKKAELVARLKEYLESQNKPEEANTCEEKVEVPSESVLKKRQNEEENVDGNKKKKLNEESKVVDVPVEVQSVVQEESGKAGEVVEANKVAENVQNKLVEEEEDYTMDIVPETELVLNHNVPVEVVVPTVVAEPASASTESSKICLVDGDCSEISNHARNTAVHISKLKRPYSFPNLKTKLQSFSKSNVWPTIWINKNRSDVVVVFDSYDEASECVDFFLKDPTSIEGQNSGFDYKIISQNEANKLMESEPTSSNFDRKASNISCSVNPEEDLRQEKLQRAAERERERLENSRKAQERLEQRLEEEWQITKSKIAEARDISNKSFHFTKAEPKIYWLPYKSDTK